MRHINLDPGYQKLDGQDALNFVRFRETDNDLYRNARQQLFLEALKDRLATSLSLFQIPQLIGALKQNIEIARGGVERHADAGRDRVVHRVSATS